MTTKLERLKDCGAVVMAAGPWGFSVTWLEDATGKDKHAAQIEATGADFDTTLDMLYLNVMAYREDRGR